MCMETTIPGTQSVLYVLIFGFSASVLQQTGSGLQLRRLRLVPLAEDGQEDDRWETVRQPARRYPHFLLVFL